MCFFYSFESYILQIATFVARCVLGEKVARVGRLKSF